MKSYSKYRDSFCEWVSQIPEDWNESALKHVITCNDEALQEKPNEDFEIDYVEIGDVSLENGIYNSTKYKFSESPSRARRVIKTNDVIISTVRTYLKAIARVPEEKNGYIASTGFAVLRPRKIDSAFLGFVVNDENFIEEILKYSVGVSYPAINSSDLINLKIPIPSLPEQKQIARYLDHQTGVIDALTAKKQTLIEKLKEQRQATINEAVTKGLNPNAPLKDSGIEWLGEIPAHWEVLRFKNCISLRHGYQFRDHDFTDSGTKIVKITQLHRDGYLDLSNCSTISSERLNDFQNIVIKPNDVLMCLTGGTIGKIIEVGEVNESLLQNYRVGHFSPITTNTLLNKYMFFFLSSDVIFSQIMFAARETGQPNIGMDNMKQMFVTLPKINEQKVIISFLEKKIKDSKDLEEKIKSQIKKLQEYRQSVISEAVTGKIDVRGWEPKT